MPLTADFASELRKHFTGDIRWDLASRILYSTDASIYQVEPLGVLIPRTQDDLQAAVETAARYRVSLIPRGAGTSLAGQAIGDGLIIDCSRWLDRIVEIDPERRLAIAEPGVILADLNRQAGRWGLQFGPDPASAERATLGGVVANNASGAHSIVYGMTADHLVSANVLLADGSRAVFGPVQRAADTAAQASPHSAAAVAPAEAPRSRHQAIVAAAREIRTRHAQDIRDRFPKTWRNSAGYRINYLLPWSPSAPSAWDRAVYPERPPDGEFNLAHLLAGSEGTLAVIQDVCLNLVPKPRHTILGILTYADEAAACDAVPGLLRLGPSAIELIPRLILQAAKTIPAYARQMSWLQGDPAALLVIEFAGDDAGALRGRLDALGSKAQVATTAEEQAMVWGMRKAGLGLLNSEPRSARPTAFIEDCAIPVEHLGGFVRDIQQVMHENGARGGVYGHASAGCLHTRPILDLTSAGGVRALREIATRTLELALKYGGAMSSEHGDGIARGEWLRQTYGDELVGAMRMLKKAADPDGILNPGKMLDAPPMDSQLRYGAMYRRKAWSPGIDLSARGGLAIAIEQCNGQGVCRKDDGVMCPSFQATREEMYSTRGRANLLRALISTGWDGQERRTFAEIDDAVYKALDLCLACKGCTAECPSGVDMARLKAAFLEHRYTSRARPIRDYFLGHFAQTARILAALGPAVNPLLSVPFFRKVGATALGLAPQRPLPRFKPKGGRSPSQHGSASVFLMRDPFSHFVDEEVEDSAIALLEAVGFRVGLISTVSGGAALISKGFLSAAREHAERLLDELIRLDPTGQVPVVALEPSEVSAVRNDLPDLLSGKPEAAERFVRIQSVEELLVGPGALARLPHLSGAKRVLFHPHCHERAEAPIEASSGAFAGVQLLRACGYEVEIVKAGCCGMGGTFGYEAEHYELSQKIGALKLFPAIAAAGDAIVAATGGACRLQITQGTGRRAEHPLVLAARALERSREDPAAAD